MHTHAHTHEYTYIRAQVDVVVKSIDQFLKLSDEVELKRRKLVCCSVDASDLDKVLPILKGYVLPASSYTHESKILFQ